MFFEPLPVERCYPVFACLLTYYVFIFMHYKALGFMTVFDWEDMLSLKKKLFCKLNLYWFGFINAFAFLEV